MKGWTFTLENLSPIGGHVDRIAVRIEVGYENMES